MIKYSLKCENEHLFEAWFPSSEGYEGQKAKGLVACPFCNSINVDKAPMAPNVKKSGEPKIADKLKSVDTSEMPKEVKEVFNNVREHIEKNFDYVGDNFAKEARDIHDGISEERPIYGEASAEDAKSLIEDGINIAPIPDVANPKAKKKIN